MAQDQKPKGVDVYRTALETYPGKQEFYFQADGRPALTIYPRPQPEAWVLQDAENWD